MNLKDKVVLVTGGSGLLGREMVRHLDECGAIAINADTSVETCLEKHLLRCDVTDSDSVVGGFSEVIRHFGRIDGLVNNAYPRTADWGLEFEEISVSSWNRNVDMQMNSVFLMCQRALEHMKGAGAIVNIASIYGVVGNDFTLYQGTQVKTAAAYSAIKGGIVNFSRYLASYAGRRGIRVNCVSPGGVFDNQDPGFVKNYEDRVPLGRMAYPSDIAPAVSFLLSDEARYITGQNLLVDGGWTAI